MRFPGMGHRPAATATLVAVVLVTAPAMALAGHRFVDVSAASPFHGDVSALADAGVTNGCAEDPPSYCPGQPVTRGQLAALLGRGLPRASFGTSAGVLNEGNDYSAVPASVTVAATGVPGGNGMVTLSGVVTLFADGDLGDCPCEVEAFVYRDSDDAAGPSTWTQLPGMAARSGTTNAAVPVNWTAPIASGASETYRVAVFLNDPPGVEVRTEASLSAVAVPFGEGAAVGAHTTPRRPSTATPAG